jgi:hypothetical protein
VTPVPTKTALQAVNEFLSEKPIPIQTTVTWKSYTRESQYLTKNNYSFNLGYPAGWWVNYQITELGKTPRVEFDIAPPGWKIPNPQNAVFLGYGSMSVDIHPHYDNINEFIKNEYGQFYQGKIEGIIDINIGNQTSYLIQAKTDSNSIFQSSWIPRNVVLGGKYSYEIGFGNGGSGDSTVIKEAIWPLLRFE